MRTNPLALLIIVLSYCQLGYAQKKIKLSNKIIIEATVPVGYTRDFINLDTRPANVITYPADQDQTIQQKPKSGIAKWVLTFSEPHNIYSVSILGKQEIIPYLVEPGDSIFINSKDNKLFFSGKGAIKMQLVQSIEEMNDSLKNTTEFKMLSKQIDDPLSLSDYLLWNDYLNKKLKLLLPLIERNKSQLSNFAYVNFKSYLLEDIEKRRMWKFNILRRAKEPGLVNHYGLSNQDLCAIYDSTMDGSASKWLRYKRSFLIGPTYTWDMLHLEDYRQKGQFFRTSMLDTSILGSDPADPFISQYNLAKRMYKGIMREELMAFTFWFSYGILNEVGFTPKVEMLLADYYQQPGYPEYKKVVREYELKKRAKWNREYAQDFTLIDKRGKLFTNQQLKGKITVFDFWFTGCTGCLQMAPALRKVEERFKNDTNVVFASVSIDKNKEQWLKSIDQKRFTTGGGLQLYTGGQGKNHEIITKFFVESYPTFDIVDPQGRFLNYDRRKIDPRIDEGLAMIAFIQKQLAITKDGPYVLYDGENVMTYFVSGGKLSTKLSDKTDIPVLPIQTDQNTTFNISLKSSLKIEAFEFVRPEKLFILSDIEGNFDALRQLLQMNKIIDEKFNWTFGDGHLVFAGDMFDRGTQVTECLWLVYSLEEKARAAGGYVHFILGNHEIMNLQGIDRYVQQKYKDNAALIGKPLAQLYNEASELGKWLRTKNVVEKIGDLLFVHGGISRKLNQLPITIAEINQFARPHYDVNKQNYGDEKANSIMNSATSPFWYRSYYDDKNNIELVIDSTLQKFNVNRIITGHTIVADSISMHYGGKVINTDTRHAEGKSEALLIVGDKYYRANATGEHILLFSEPTNTLLLQQHPIKDLHNEGN